MITQREMIAVLNAASSSLKFSLYEASGPPLRLIARGQFDLLGTAPHFEAMDNLDQPLANETLPAASDPFEHSQAVHHLARWIREKYGEHMALQAVGHRITHGGGEYGEPVLVNGEVLEMIEALVPLAPLHQPHNLDGVKAVRRMWPDLPQVACFDTAFHHNRPPVAERFGLPGYLFDRGLKRWGFHGLSYESISTRFASLAPRVAAGRVIVAHLGNGASLCAMKGGRGIDTTTSFSTLDGLPTGTRSGSLDPGAVLYLMRQMNRDEIEMLLYRRSGLLGISGISGDMRVLLASKEPRAAEAIDYFVYRVIREIGSLTAALGGLDALIFTAGIGVNSPLIRARVCRALAWLGMAIDSASNERRDACISPPGRSPSVWVIPTDEDGVIAAHTWKIVSMLPHRASYDRGGRSDGAA